MHQIRKGVERVCSSASRRLRSDVKGYATASKAGGEGSKTIGQSIQKSSASTATASHLQNKGGDGAGERRRPKGVPLDVPFPGVQSPAHAQAEKLSFETKVTEVEGGLRVGSSLRYGKYCTIGVTIKSGSRFETGFPQGISHIAEKLGFLSSQNFATKAEILKELEVFGAICDSQTSRDTTVYAISTEVQGVERLMKLLSDVVLRPRITEEELLNARQTALYEIEDMHMRPEQEMVILEMIHSAAWNKNTLGFPRYSPIENADGITRNELLRYMKTNYQSNRMAISGVGVEHNMLVDLAKEYFVTDKTTWNDEQVQAKPISEPAAVYTGGDTRVQKDFGQFNAGPMPVPKLAHMALGLQSVAHSDSLFIPACVLNILMGGGGSFSAGGPGKGMYSRLYTNVLNTKHWVYNATAYNNSYSDSGLFCIYGSAPPEYMKNLTDVLMLELHGMAKAPEEEEFMRAKKQLQSMLLMNLESRPVVFEDIGRQLLAHGHYKPPTDYLIQIEKVTDSDLTRLAKLMLQSKPSLASLGDISQVPSYSDIVNRKNQLREPTKSFFKQF